MRFRAGSSQSVVDHPRHRYRGAMERWRRRGNLTGREIKIVRTVLTGSEATAFAIADNRTSETSRVGPDRIE